MSFYRPVLDTVEVICILEAENERFYAFVFSRMIHAADKSFLLNIIPRMENAQLCLFKGVDLRVSFEKSTREQRFFAAMRQFLEMYEQLGLGDLGEDGQQRELPTTEHVLVNSTLTVMNLIRLKSLDVRNRTLAALCPPDPTVH